MPRERTGSVIPFTDERGRRRYKVGITLDDGARTFKRLPPGTTEKRAKETAASWNEKAAIDPTLTLSGPSPGETFAAWSVRWVSYREEKGLTSTRDDHSRLRTHILPKLGARPVAAITVIIQLINEFRTYDLPYVLTKGGPGTATEVLSFFAYRQAFLGLSINEGAAAAFVLLVIVLAMTVVFFAMLEKRAKA